MPYVWIDFSVELLSLRLVFWPLSRCAVDKDISQEKTKSWGIYFKKVEESL